MLKRSILYILLAILSASSMCYSATYYVRTDGGVNGTCDGTLNIQAAGSTGGHCAWSHPFEALPPGGTARISGGDTLIVGGGSYRMGTTSGVYTSGSCSTSWPYDCRTTVIPGGPDADHKTKIYGEGWDSGCGDAPELYGVERTKSVLRTNESSNIDMRCLEITDHSQCVEFHSGGIGCNRSTYPYGDWAQNGLEIYNGSNIEIKDVNIHGIANRGAYISKVVNFSADNFRLVGNGWAGWDGDNPAYTDDSNSGGIILSRLLVEWNGCGETYPEQQPIGCWGQTAGGYGDGLGTTTSGGDWVITDSKFLHNAQDGLDLLYLDSTGTVSVNRVISEGNAGNQLKVSGLESEIINSVAVGNCSFFSGKSFDVSVDDCRALGHPIAIRIRQGGTSTVINSSIYSEGDGVFNVTQFSPTCNGTENLRIRNTAIYGDIDYLQNFESTAYLWNECSGLNIDHDYVIGSGLKGGLFDITTNTTFSVNSPEHNQYLNPKFQTVSPGTDEFYLMPQADSPLIDAGLQSFDMAGSPNVPIIDVLGRQRSVTDIGAYEFGGAIMGKRYRNAREIRSE